MIVKTGVDDELEQAADALLWDSLKGVTKFSEKADILTPWKAKDRKNHEVLTPSGLAQTHHRQGTYGRRDNRGDPSLNSREGLAGLRKRRPRPLHAWMVEQGYGEIPDTPPAAER